MLACCAAPRPGAPLAMPPAPVLSMATAFFLAPGDAALTAAHAVAGCRALALALPGLPPVAATVSWRDERPDLALLRAPGLRAPATLVLADSTSVPASAGGRGGRKLLALGFSPDGGGTPRRAAALELNGRMASGMPADPRRVLWLRAPGVGHGWSGGPVLDPATGRVVGAISFIAPGDAPGLAVAVGAGTIGAALRAAGLAPDAGPGRGPPAAALARLYCRR